MHCIITHVGAAETRLPQVSLRSHGAPGQPTWAAAGTPSRACPQCPARGLTVQVRAGGSCPESHNRTGSFRGSSLFPLLTQLHFLLLGLEDIHPELALVPAAVLGPGLWPLGVGVGVITWTKWALGGDPRRRVWERVGAGYP